jgi:hypothetical protein
MKKRKKGNVILMFLMWMIIILFFAGILINMTMLFETFNREVSAIEEAAKVRAQAVDTPLKEFNGTVEVMHPYYGYEDNVDHEDVSEKYSDGGSSGHLRPFDPSEDLYQRAVQNADTDAKEAALMQLHLTTGNNISGEPLVPLTADDICFDIQPLPDTAGVVHFSCQTPNGHDIAGDVFVSGKNDVSYIAPDPKDNIIVQNVVFAGAAMPFNLFIWGPLADIGMDLGGVNEVYSVAYPQVNKCTPGGKVVC